MPIERLRHAGVRGAELERSLRFYRDLPGFEECSRSEGRGGGSAMVLGTLEPALAAVFLEREGVAEVQTLEGDEPSGDDGSAVACPPSGFQIRELAAVLDQLRAAGAQVVESSRRRDSALGSEVVLVSEPEGRRIELIDAPAGYDIWRGGDR